MQLCAGSVQGCGHLGCGVEPNRQSTRARYAPTRSPLKPRHCPTDSIAKAASGAWATKASARNPQKSATNQDLRHTCFQECEHHRDSVSESKVWVPGTPPQGRLKATSAQFRAKSSSCSPGFRGAGGTTVQTRHQQGGGRCCATLKIRAPRLTHQGHAAI